MHQDLTAAQGPQKSHFHSVKSSLSQISKSPQITIPHHQNPCQTLSSFVRSNTLGFHLVLCTYKLLPISTFRGDTHTNKYRVNALIVPCTYRIHKSIPLGQTKIAVQFQPELSWNEFGCINIMPENSVCTESNYKYYTLRGEKEQQYSSAVENVFSKLISQWVSSGNPYITRLVYCNNNCLDMFFCDIWLLKRSLNKEFRYSSNKKAKQCTIFSNLLLKLLDLLFFGSGNQTRYPPILSSKTPTIFVGKL